MQITTEDNVTSVHTEVTFRDDDGYEWKIRPSDKGGLEVRLVPGGRSVPIMVQSVSANAIRLVRAAS